MTESGIKRKRRESGKERERVEKREGERVKERGRREGERERERMSNSESHLVGSGRNCAPICN